jgi:hypothetical protein
MEEQLLGNQPIPFDYHGAALPNELSGLAQNNLQLTINN